MPRRYSRTRWSQLNDAGASAPSARSMPPFLEEGWRSGNLASGIWRMPWSACHRTRKTLGIPEKPANCSRRSEATSWSVGASGRRDRCWSKRWRTRPSTRNPTPLRCWPGCIIAARAARSWSILADLAEWCPSCVVADKLERSEYHRCAGCRGGVEAREWVQKYHNKTCQRRAARRRREQRKETLPAGAAEVRAGRQ